MPRHNDEQKRQVGSDVLRALLGPEVPQRIDADDGHALLGQPLADGLVDVALSAVAGDDDRKPCHGTFGFDDRDRKVRRSPLAGPADLYALQ